MKTFCIALVGAFILGSLLAWSAADYEKNLKSCLETNQSRETCEAYLK